MIDINPSALTLGPIDIRWYSLMYVFGFMIGGQILNKLSGQGFLKVDKIKIDSYITMLIVGMLLGARIFYVFIYNWDEYSSHPQDIIAVWKGGLSFHGALVGMLISTYLFAKRNGLHFFHVADCLALAGTPGLFLGRIGNFINGELYGRITDSPFGVVFRDGGPYPRHPSQLYEGLGEGLLIFTICFFLYKRVKIYGVLSSVFLGGYGLVRFLVEFLREPDAQLGYYLGGYFTMGQILCFVMMFICLFMYLYVRKLNLPNPLYQK